MSKFFVSDEVYNDRMSICKECVYYFKPTGSCKVCMCFMKIKSRIAVMGCPQKYWQPTKEVVAQDDLPNELIEAILEIFPLIKNGRAKNQEVKKRMIEIYNSVHKTQYGTGTNCGSCLATIYKSMVNLAIKYSDYEEL